MKKPAFGTSGLRGLVTSLTDYVVYNHVTAFLHYLSEIGEFNLRDKVIVGGDLRPSTPNILKAVCTAIQHFGAAVDFAGYLPSPALAFAGFQEKKPSIMVTGSHIPFDRNGIKFNRPTGELLKSDEPGILENLGKIDEALFFEESLISPLHLPEINTFLVENYLNRYANFFDKKCLVGLKIGIYQHSGVGRDLLTSLLQNMGATVVPLGRSEEFVALDTEAIREEDIVLAKKWVQHYELDALVTTDGDADRPMIADEKGEWWRGDILGILVSKYLGINAVVTPVSSNTAVELTSYFDHVLRTKIGSPYVIDGINALADMHTKNIAGYEANGGFILGAELNCGEKTLKALPTRDAFLPILTVLAEAKKRCLPLSTLLGDLPERFTLSDRLQNFPTEKSQQKLQRYKMEDEKLSFKNFSSEFSFVDSKINTINVIDGVRVIFENGDVIHLRPSGNAPELRCYVESASKFGAKFLLEKSMVLIHRWNK